MSISIQDPRLGEREEGGHFPCAVPGGSRETKLGGESGGQIQGRLCQPIALSLSGTSSKILQDLLEPDRQAASQRARFWPRLASLSHLLPPG